MVFYPTFVFALGILTTSSLALAGEKVPFESLPAPVKTTVQREVKTGQILEIERDSNQGKEVFEVEFTDPNGVKWELDIAPDGALLSKRED
jgi:uncharacterized membrane protein YkoI